MMPDEIGPGRAYPSVQERTSVREARLPYYLPREKLHLMGYWAEKLRWIPLLALVIEEHARFYDIRRLQAKGGSCRIDERTEAIDNLLILGN